MPDQPQSPRGPFPSRPPALLVLCVACVSILSSRPALGQITKSLDQMESSLSLSPDGRFASYFSYRNYSINLMDLETGSGQVISNSGGTNVVSRDGRYVAYLSYQPQDRKLYVKDVQTGATTQLNGSIVLYESLWVQMTPDGRYVVFEGGHNTATNQQIYVHDRDPDGNGTYDEGNGVIELVSVDPNGQPANDRCFDPAIAADGLRIAFASKATNLVPNDTNGFNDVFVRDRAVGVTGRVSLAPDGSEANADSGAVEVSGCSYPPCASYTLTLSGDGRIVAFASAASNLVVGDTNGKADVFVRDLVHGSTELVSRDSQGNLGDGDSGAFGIWFYDCCYAYYIGTDGVALDHDGRFVAFPSRASNLVADQRDPSDADLYSHDRLTGHTQIESVTSYGEDGHRNDLSFAPVLSADGNVLLFYSDDALDPSGPPNSHSGCRFRLSSRLVGTPHVGNTIHFELVQANDRRTGELAIVLLSCSGVNAFPLPGGLTLYLTFDACAIAGLSLIPVLSAGVLADGTAATPPVVFPDLPPGFRFYATVVTANGNRVTATTDPIVIDVQ